MLLSFRIANHRSLRDQQQLLLTPGYATDVPPDAAWQAVPVIGIFGPNASGKSNIIDALIYMSRMVRGSLRESEPGAGIDRHPFALDPDMADEPSSYVIDLLLDDVRYTYGFAIDDTRVVEEWMYSYPHKRQRTIFHRRGDKYTYGEHSPESMRRVEEITDPSVLFLSVAARSKQELVQPVYRWFMRLQMRSSSATRLHRPFSLIAREVDRSGFLERLTLLLQAADTGIESAELVEETEEELAARYASVRGDLPKDARLPRNQELVLRHRGAHGSVPMSLRDQSLGTQALCALGIPAFTALDRGVPFVVDELDSSLHPYLAAQLIRLFRDPQTNPRGAQLLFTSHDPTLLGRIQGEEVLQRDHVWFTEKDDTGVTELFPLSEFKPRAEENKERRYLAGRYGAVPIVKDELFAAALAARGDEDDVPPDS
jgi:predicted ATPase